MDTPYPIVERFQYPELTAKTYETGGRVYFTPEGHRVPSVTTILSILPKDGLIEWRNRVGDQEADRIVEEACDIGSTMHESLEGYVSNYLRGRPDVPPVTPNELIAYRLADNMRRYALTDLDEIWGIEEALYCEHLYAGRTDLVGVYKGKSAIIDYKSSRMWKKPEWVENYKMQIAAYNFAHKAMFGEGMESGVILIAIRPNYKGEIRTQRFILDKGQLEYYEEKWLATVDKYYRENHEVKEK